MTIVFKYVCACCHRNHHVVILCFLAYVFSALGIQQLKSDGLLSECKVFPISTLAHSDDLSQTVCHSLLFHYNRTNKLSSHCFKCVPLEVLQHSHHARCSIVISRDIAGPLSAVPFLVQLYLSDSTGPMRQSHTAVLVSQVSCMRFLSPTLDSCSCRFRLFALDVIVSMCGDHLILLSSTIIT